MGVDGYELVIDESVKSCRCVRGGDRHLHRAARGAIRLLSGRLKPEFTPAGVEVTGNVTLDELREVFPGY